jgi:hypothetical protein
VVMVGLVLTWIVVLGGLVVEAEGPVRFWCVGLVVEMGR